MPISLFGKSRKNDEKNAVSENPKPVYSNESQSIQSKITQSGSVSTVSSSTSAIPVSSPNIPPPQKAGPVIPKAAPTVPSRISATSKKGKGKRRPRNTVVVSLQMPAALVKVLDEIVEAGAYRSRSDVILQAVRSHPEVSRRLARLEAKQPPKK